MESTSRHSTPTGSGLHDHKHLPPASKAQASSSEIPAAMAKLDARSPFILRDKPVSIHLIRDGKLSFDDLSLAPIKTGPLKGRGEKAMRGAQERLLDHLLNREIGRCRGRRCVDVSRVVHAYYGGKAGVAFALAHAPLEEQQAAARFLKLGSDSPALNLQYEPQASLNRGVQALTAVARHFDKAVEGVTATVRASAEEPQSETALGQGTAWAYAHGHLYARLRELGMALDSTRGMREQFFDTLAEWLDDGSKTISELDSLVEDAIASTRPARVDGDVAIIETKAGPGSTPTLGAPTDLAGLFLTNGATGDPGADDDDTAPSSAAQAPVKQHGDTDWLAFNHYAAPRLRPDQAGTQGE